MKFFNLLILCGLVLYFSESDNKYNQYCYCIAKKNNNSEITKIVEIKKECSYKNIKDKEKELSIKIEYVKNALAINVGDIVKCSQEEYFIKTQSSKCSDNFEFPADQ